MAYFRRIANFPNKSRPILTRYLDKWTHDNVESSLFCYRNIFFSIRSKNDQKLRNEEDLYSLENIVSNKLWNTYLYATDIVTEKELSRNLIVLENFLTEEEEKSISDEIEPYMKRLRYEFDHWDNAIHGYRETERRKWNEKNKSILDRVRNLAFPSDVAQLAYVHILDITKEGYIKPHVDSVKFCGNVIAGLCLLSPCVMRVVNTKDNTKYGDVLLKQRSLYIMKDLARYNYTHEVLKEEESMFKGVKVPRDRRISVICRNEPAPEIT